MDSPGGKIPPGVRALLWFWGITMLATVLFELVKCET